MKAAIKIIFLCYVTPYILVEAYCISEELIASALSTRSTLLIRKGKAVPLQAWSGPEGSRKLNHDNGTGWW